MADDPKFEPIYRDIASHGKTLMAHQAEPDVAWGPPDPSDPSSSYYRENPQWYVAGRPGFPSKQKILDARDHVLANNPQLRMVGVHLGSMERDLDNIARHFDKYPNFAIDTAARMRYLMLMPPKEVRAFLIQYSGSCPLRHRSRFPRGRQSSRSGERLAVQLRARLELSGNQRNV